MLILSRKPGERIIIADNIIVEVMSVDGEKVKIGVIAPREMAVDRLEVHEAKKGERRE